jgi:hypothetical protein
MTSSEKISIAALIGVTLRRKTNRTIDVKWLLENDVYAKEVIRLCREQGQSDLTEYADSLDKLIFGKTSLPATSFATTVAAKTRPVFVDSEIPTHELEEEDGKLDTSKYVGRLR